MDLPLHSHFGCMRSFPGVLLLVPLKQRQVTRTRQLRPDHYNHCPWELLTNPSDPKHVIVSTVGHTPSPNFLVSGVERESNPQPSGG
ncbi:hypothetical protein FA15DRAFT_676183 [Coprinopsis marcescibilis]|uniref:Uncharacterized protein n=1 Tax=Coprinopsis marcescibilis TaxID=230819 RepID=A0A5C3KB14_COPMA|nr:hypothetical protein FA15DRAFT_676183 [Coprinopsis marcescibilis]